MKKNEKYPWYLAVLDFPGAIVFLFFLVLVFLYVSLCRRKEIKNKKISERITLQLLPFVLAIIISIVGYVVDAEAVLNYVKYAAGISILYLLINSFRFIHNPFSFLNKILIEHLRSDQRLIPELAKEAMERGANYDTSKIAPTKTDAITLFVKLFGKGVLNLAENPRIVLGLFLIHYFSSVFLTILLFGVMLKTTFLQFYDYEFSSFFLASVLRFTAWSSITEILQGYSNQWVLAYESSVTFFYIVIAITSFGAISSHTTQEIHGIIKLIYDQEMKTLEGIRSELIENEITKEKNN